MRRESLRVSPAHRAELRRAIDGGGTVSRRSVLGAIGLALGVPALGAASAGYAMRVEPRLVEATATRVALARLPASLSGLRIVHMSDLHSGPYVEAAHIRQAVRVANSLSPDLVVITGDFVYHTIARLGECAQELARLTPRVGTVAVLGNHDVWTAPAAVYEALRSAGITPLADAKVAVESGATRLWLLGIEDRGYSGYAGGSPAVFARHWQTGLGAVERMLADVSPEEPRLLLVHNPDFCEMLTPGQVDLALCGHTHGGQVRLPLIGSPIVPSNYGQKYALGLVQGPACPVYVTRGIGVTPPAVRFGCRPEVALLTLQGGNP